VGPLHPSDSYEPSVQSPAISTRSALWAWLVHAGVPEDDADGLTQQAELPVDLI